ncbi:MAG: hypothetical protein Q8Q46_03290 [Candidatus Giovannonibacteria bacterium]|nr:hypothetical protein [Candidatus Giovannonibacteria bacterium]
MAEESLIPKKFPAAQYASESFGVFFRISAIIFLVSLLFTAGIYVYGNFLKNSLADQKSVLQKVEIEFEPNTIAELERVSGAIASAGDILRGHTMSSDIFVMVEASALPTTSFNTFFYSAEKNMITLTGEAASYSDVSAQSSVFESLPNVESATFGNLALKETGTVGFILNVQLKTQ